MIRQSLLEHTSAHGHPTPLACALALALAGCSDHHFGDTTDTLVTVTRDIATHSGSEADIRSDASVSQDSAPVGCDPGRVACARGVLAICDSDGLQWHYGACPPGQICDSGACVDNVGTIVLAVNSPLPGNAEHPPAALPAELSTNIYSELCTATPECCEAYASALASGGNDATVIAAKYWIRRLLKHLGSNQTSWFALLGPPTSEPEILPAPECQVEVARHNVPCLGGTRQLMTLSDYTALETTLAPPGVAPLVSDLPAWNDRGETTPSFDKLMRATLKGEGTVRPGDSQALENLLRWVDGINGGQGGDPVNPEINLDQAQGYVMTLAAYSYLAHDARPQGRACRVDSDCRTPHYRCNANGECDDPAAACRVQDVVFLGPFLQPTQAWSPNECVGGPGTGIDHNVWTQWMRWGIGCEKHVPCPSGSTCRDVCSIFDSEFCHERLTCLPNEVDIEIDAAGWLEPILSRFVDDYRGAFPTFYSEDAAGRRFVTTSHAIFSGASPDQAAPAFAPLDHATAAATVGGGVAVTPCAPDFELPSPDHVVSALINCDYESAYEKLATAIRHHARDAVCSPEIAGLPESSPSLLE